MYTTCPYYVVLYIQSICNVSLLCSALYWIDRSSVLLGLIKEVTLVLRRVVRLKGWGVSRLRCALHVVLWSVEPPRGVVKRPPCVGWGACGAWSTLPDKMPPRGFILAENLVLAGLRFRRRWHYRRRCHSVLAGRPMSCVPGYFEVIKPHTVGSLTIPRASIKWV